MNKNLLLDFMKAAIRLRILVVTFVVFVALCIISPIFRTPNNILENVLRPASTIAIISLGMTFILA
jgi:ribose/xylose/arabinose/galactoside ABC-type transport system permease subunit